MIILFCGVPGSGKTTTAKCLAEILTEFGHVKLIVSDEIGSKVYNRIFKLVEKGSNGADYILVDATFYKKYWREVIETVGGRDHVLTCYLSCSLNTCLERNRARSPSLPERVIHIIHKEMERPLHPELSIDTEKTAPHESASKIADWIIRTRDELQCARSLTKRRNVNSV
jgi:tRNA uridine 5-carbamoylmethylation protein Kti12